MTPEKAELMPCPFCGGPAETDSARGYRALADGRIGDGAAVYCRECNADMMICYADVPEVEPSVLMADLIAAWNRRALSPAAQAASDAPGVVGLAKQLRSLAENWKLDGDMTGAVAVEQAAILIQCQHEQIAALHPTQAAKAEDVYVNGVWKCAKCNFRLVQANLNANTGTVTARDDPGDKCPNCNSPLWRVTWKDEAEENLAIGEQQVARAVAAEAEVTRLTAAIADRSTQAKAEDVEPFAYAWEYHSDFGNGTTIRFNHGQEVNGGKPIRAIPLYSREQLAAALAQASTPPGYVCVKRATLAEIETLATDIAGNRALRLGCITELVRAMLAASPNTTG